MRNPPPDPKAPAPVPKKNTPLNNLMPIILMVGAVVVGTFLLGGWEYIKHPPRSDQAAAWPQSGIEWLARTCRRTHQEVPAQYLDAYCQCTNGRVRNAISYADFYDAVDDLNTHGADNLGEKVKPTFMKIGALAEVCFKETVRR